MLLRGIFHTPCIQVVCACSRETLLTGPRVVVKRLLHSGPQRALNVTTQSSAARKNKLAGNFDTLGAWNHRIELAVNLEQSLKKGKLIPEISLDNVGTASLLGRRKANEDRFTITEITPDVLMFAIYDGHGGAAAVDYVSDNMPDRIRHELDLGQEDLSEVLRKAFITINEDFARYFVKSGIANEITTTSGTTATVCLLRYGIELVVGHVGDSRAVLCREGRVIRLTSDHEPDEPAERARVESCGGRIVQSSLGRPRVQGRLEMTRSIGDLELKPYGVTEVPEIRSIEVKHGEDAFLGLTTDGVHFVLNDQELVDIICLSKDPEEAARLVTDNALQFGSEDNATTLVVPFGAWGKYEKTARKGLQFSFGRNNVGRRFC